MGMEIQKVATDLDDGTFSVRTTSLHAHRHAEVEIAPIPFEAVEAAAKIIDYVVESVVGKGKQLRAGENVGLPLSIAGHEDVGAIFVGVHAAPHEPAVSGFFAKLRGTATFGVLRLIDLPGVDPGPPVEAVAAMMLYRANCRLVSGDVEGALRELRDSVRIVPGDPDAGPPPDFEPPEGASMNWQNHLGYLKLAELAGREESDAIYAEAFGRFDWLARRDLGAELAVLLAGADESTLYEDAKRILEKNRAESEIAPGPQPGMRLVPSPIWLAGEDGSVARELSILPAGFADYSFGDRLASPEVSDALARDAAACVDHHRDAPWTAWAMTATARDIYGRSPFSKNMPDVAYRPWFFLLSAVLAAGARFLHAGATPEEMRWAFGLVSNDPALQASLGEKLARLEAWEGEQYMSALGAP